MNKFTNKKAFIGIDISKESLDLALIQETSYGQFEDFKIENSFNGFDKIHEWLEKRKLNLKTVCSAWNILVYMDSCYLPGSPRWDMITQWNLA